MTADEDREERELLEEEDDVVEDGAAGVDARERRPDAVKTRIETMATMTRNVVPQRGCSVVFARAFSTASASPAS